MKQSEYILDAYYKDELLMFNLINQTLVSIPKSEEQKVIESLKNPNNTSNKYWQEMYANQFIIDDDVNEKKLISENHWKGVVSSETYSITIITTLSCNLNCVYCYQKNMNLTQLSFTDEDYRGLYQFISTLNCKYININFYGGEPLLCYEQIIKFMNKLAKDKKHEYFYSISTNATIFDFNKIKKLKEYGLTSIDTTLAGNYLDHNKLRKSIQYTQKDIIENIVNYSKYVDVVVSINLCRENLEGIRELILELSAYKDLPIYITFNRIESHINNPCDEIVLSEDEYMTKVIEFANYALDNKVKICDMSCFQNNGIFCGAYSNTNITVGPQLYIYKCENKFVPETAFGRINDGKIVINSKNNIEAYKENYKFCNDCKLLPYCNGGCQENLRQTGSPCPVEKLYLKDYLVLYYRKNCEI